MAHYNACLVGETISQVFGIQVLCPKGITSDYEQTRNLGEQPRLWR